MKDNNWFCLDNLYIGSDYGLDDDFGDYTSSDTYKIRASNFIKKVRKLVIPSRYENKKIISVGEGGFEYMYSLKEVRLEEGIRFIEPYAFHHCMKLEVLYLPKSFIEAHKDAFIFTNIKDIYYEEGTIEVDCEGFWNLPGVCIHIPSSVNRIYNSKSPFFRNDNQIKLIVDSKNTTYEVKNNCLKNK